MSAWGSFFRKIKHGKKTGGFALVLASGAVIGGPLTLQHEGMKLAPYYDSVGVKTWCAGETEIGYKEEFTQAECAALFSIRYGYYSERTALFYNEKAKKIVTPEIHAAFVDMAYNVGLGAVGKSSMIRDINAGNPVGACNSILLYKRAGGKDCSIRTNGCYGVWLRRLKMNELCLKGVP